MEEIIKSNIQIKVKNAEGDSDTTATIIHQNSIDYEPKVSVIIPVYNTEEYLCECLDSVVNQTLKEIEIICVDDGSTDNSLEILKEYAQKDNRFTIITQKNLHAGVARNAGLAVARGVYVHFLDSDDWVEENIYIDTVFETDSEMIIFDSYKVDKMIDKKISWDKDYLKITETTENLGWYQFVKCSNAPWNKLFRREFVLKNNIFFQKLICCNDVYFVKLSFALSKNIKLVDKLLYNWRFNANNNISSKRGENSMCVVKYAKQLCKSLIERNLFDNREEIIYKNFLPAFVYEYSQCSFDKRNELEQAYKDFLPSKYYNDLVKEIVPMVSVIVPVYNAEKTLRRCLDSLLSQTCKNVEIICINDGSTDKSIEILNLYRRLDHRIYVVNKENSGPAFARNLGLEIARGKYIAFLDSDDYMVSEAIDTLLKEAQKDDADVVVCKYYLKSINSEKENKVSGHYALKNFYRAEELKDNLYTISNPVPWNKLYKKSLLCENQVKFPDLKASEDVYFTCLAMTFAQKIRFVEKPLLYWTYDNISSLHHHQVNKYFENNFIVYEMLREKLIESGNYNVNEQAFHKAFLNTTKWCVGRTLVGKLEVCQIIQKYMQIFNIKQENCFYKNFLEILANLKRNNVIISLTSYPARINSVHITIESLLKQSLRADKVILWLAPEQFPNKEADLPQELLDLKESGLIIDWYHDIRSYKKLIPTLKKYPDAIIVTADDDNIYSPSWLKKLYDSYLKYPIDIHAHRITKFFYKHGFEYIAGGQDYYKESSYLNKLVGLGGVLYPPNCFYKDILNEELFMKLAPTNDDQWFWFQAVLKGRKIRVVENPEIKANYVEGTQQFGLTNINDKGEKLFWKDFHRLLTYYPKLRKLLINTGKKYAKKNMGTIDRYKDELITWYKRVMCKDLNLENPQTFNEKIQWLKLYDSTPLKTKLADKYLVRDWVKEKIGEKYLIPLLGVYNNFDDINFDKLPNQFVIKCNHGSGYNIVVKDKLTFNKQEAKTKIDKWMNEDFAFKFGVELHYRDIPHKIIIEKFLDEISNNLYDYRFFCCNGKIKQIWLDVGSGTPEHKRKIYDKNWNELDIKVKWPRLETNVPKPKNLQKMIQMSEKMSKKFTLVRVDFYDVKDKIYFGEMTFTSMSGTGKFEPEIEDLKLGKKIKLPKKAYNVDTGEYYKLPNYKLKSFLQNVFSIKNEPIRNKHKIITILGLKLKIHKKDYGVSSFVENIFSIKNEHIRKQHKIITILGLKLKIKRKEYGDYSFIERIFSVKNKESRDNKWYKVITILGVKFSFKNKELTQRKNLIKFNEKIEEQVCKIDNQNNRLIEQEKNIKAQELKIKEQVCKIDNQNNQLMEQENRIKVQELKIKEQVCKIDNQNNQLIEQENRIKAQELKIEEQVCKIDNQNNQLMEQENRIKVQELKIEEQVCKIDNQNNQLMEQENRIKVQELKIEEQIYKIDNQKNQIIEQENKIKELVETLALQDSNLKNEITGLNQQIKSQLVLIENLKRSYNQTLQMERLKQRYKLHKYLPEEKRAEALKDWYFDVTGEYLDLDNPQTFNEKIQWLKLYDSTPLKTKLADKYLVRDWVKEKIGEEYLIPLLGVCDNFDDIDFDNLPNQFVIKCNHGSGYNIIVKDKLSFNKDEARKKINTWMNEDFAFCAGFEMHYSDIPRKIIIEEYIDLQKANIEIQSWCFNGELKFISYETCKDAEQSYRAIFTPEWELENFMISPQNYSKFPETPKKPLYFKELKNVVSKLCKGIKHVRIDFAVNEDKLIFREMTFTSASGLSKFEPSEAKYRIGEMIKLDNLGE